MACAQSKELRREQDHDAVGSGYGTSRLTGLKETKVRGSNSCSGSQREFTANPGFSFKFATRKEGGLAETRAAVQATDET